jgi:mRNA-degrading endonuclease HigB of HigAB toxin-antitoxin module
MEQYPDAANEIRAWVGIGEAVRWHNFAEVSGMFKDADYVDGYVIFNIPYQSGSVFKKIRACDDPTVCS